MKLPSIKIQLIGFLILFAVYLLGIEKEAIFLSSIFLAVSAAIITDSCLIYLKKKEKTITSSSIISGLIVSFVLSSSNQWWVFSLASILAVASKHFIQINKKHLFNPAAIGVFLAVILLGASTQWRGSGIWYILIPAGFYFVTKIRKLEIAIAYLVSFLVLSVIQAFFQNTPLLDAMKHQNYFFIFVMLIEPKTTPIKPLGKFIFGAGISLLIFILTEIGFKFEAELFSLLIFNSFVPLLNKL